MRRIILGAAVAAWAATALAGCGKVDGPRFWWDDRTQTRLSEDYRLPDDPGAPGGTELEKPASRSGADLTDQSLDDYRTDMDAKEERRKSEAALFDF